RSHVAGAPKRSTAKLGRWFRGLPVFRPPMKSLKTKSRMKPAQGRESARLKAFFQVVLSLAVACLPLAAASAQQEAQPSPLTLQQAVNVALEKNPLRKAAIADTKAASSEV